MKKKLLLKSALAVMFLAALCSCKKEDAKTSSTLQLNNEISGIDTSKEDEGNNRLDEYTQAYQTALHILVDSLTCTSDYDIKNLHSVGHFSGGYVFCASSIINANTHLVIMPKNLILSAFVVHNLQPFSNGVITLLPEKVYDYEIYDACDSELLLDGRIYPNLGDETFVVSNVYATNFIAYQFNLVNVFNNSNTGTYSYYGPPQSTIRLTLDEFLFGIAKGCYLNLH